MSVLNKMKNRMFRFRLMLRRKIGCELPVCLNGLSGAWEEAYYTVFSLVSVKGSNRLAIHVVFDVCDPRYEKLIMDLQSDVVKIVFVSPADWKRRRAGYKKWLYVEPGIIFCKCPDELYITKISGKAFAAALYLKNSVFLRYIQEAAAVPADVYVNTDVMLIHEPVMCHYYEALEKTMEDRRASYHAMEEALNEVCRDNIFLLNQRWNCSWEPLLADSRNEFLIYEDNVRFLDAVHQPFAMNYRGLYKPWSYPIRQGTGYFWRVLMETPLFSEKIHDISLKTGKHASIIMEEVDLAIRECNQVYV